MKRNVLTQYLIITASCALYAVGFNWMFDPNHISVGGFTGLGQIINYLLPGLPIGTIVSIHQNENDFVKYAVIRPSVDFSKLEEVFVILKSADTGSYEKPEVTPKLVPQTNRDKVEGIKGAAAL